MKTEPMTVRVDLEFTPMVDAVILKPSDVLVLRMKEPVDDDEFQAISAAVARVLPRGRYLLVNGELEVAVVRNGTEGAELFPASRYDSTHAMYQTQVEAAGGPSNVDT